MTIRLASPELAEQLLAATRDGVAIVGPTGALLSWNAAARAITGWSKDDAGAHVVTAIPDGLSEIRDGKWIDTRRFSFRIGADLHTALLFADATAQVELTEAKRKLADIGLVDPSTGLPGRTLGLDHLARALSLAHRDKRSVGVLAIELTPPAERQRGTLVALDLVRQVVRRLVASTRTSDFLAQTGPLEFVLILTAMNGASESAMVVTARLLLVLAQPFVSGGRERSLAAAIGISHGPEEGVSALVLLERAEDALREARSEGSGYRLWQSRSRTVPVDHQP